MRSSSLVPDAQLPVLVLSGFLPLHQQEMIPSLSRPALHLGSTQSTPSFSVPAFRATPKVPSQQTQSAWSHAGVSSVAFMAMALRSRTTCHAGEEAPRRRNGSRKPRKPKKFSPFCTKATQWRGQTGRGKKGHFHLLDRYIRRIDALLPEDMEDLVRPMSYKPNQEQTTRSIKITFPDAMVAPADISEEEVRSFLAPTMPRSIALGWTSEEGNAEVFVLFEDNEDCRTARQLDGQRLGSFYAQVRFTVDNKFRRVMEDLGYWEKGSNQLDSAAAEQPEVPVEQEAALPADA
eukprot:s895_g18.t1